MADCSYCGDSFEDEDAYLDHLAAAHRGELSRIDRRRVEEREGDGDGDAGLPTGPLILGGILVVAIGGVLYLTVLSGGSSATGPITVNGIEVAQTPAQQGTDHAHGIMNVTIESERIDLSREEYQLNDGRFHFEAGNGRVWHAHAQGITLEYAMATLGIEVTDSSVTFEGTIYNDSDPGTTVVVEVNGQDVDPSSYVLKGAGAENPEQGDHVRIVVRANESG